MFVKSKNGGLGCGDTRTPCPICYIVVGGKITATGRYCPDGVTGEQFETMTDDDAMQAIADLDVDALLAGDEVTAPPASIAVDWQDIFATPTPAPQEAQPEVIYLPAKRDKQA